MSLSFYEVKTSLEVNGTSLLRRKPSVLLRRKYVHNVVSSDFIKAKNFALQLASSQATASMADNHIGTITSIDETLEYAERRTVSEIVVYPPVYYSKRPKTLYHVSVKGQLVDVYDPNLPLVKLFSGYSVLASNHDAATLFAQSQHQQKILDNAKHSTRAARIPDSAKSLDTTIVSTSIIAETVYYDPTVEVKRA